MTTPGRRQSLALGRWPTTLLLLLAAVLHITTASLPDAVRGRPYYALICAAGDPAPYTWTIAKGKLNPGLKLGKPLPHCIPIEGRALDTGKVDFTVRVTGR